MTKVFAPADIQGIVPPLVAFCILFPVLFFPFARAYWLAMDLSFDRYRGEDDEL